MRNHLVRPALNQAGQDVSLARREGCHEAGRGFVVGDAFVRLAHAEQRAADGGDQLLLAIGFLNEIDGACLHHPHRETHIAVPGDHDDRELMATCCQFSLELQPIHAGHQHIRHKTGRPQRGKCLQKILRRRMRLREEAEGREQQRGGAPDRFVIINEMHDGATSIRP